MSYVWAPVDVNLLQNHKTARLARYLGSSRPHVIGYLVCLWSWALVHAPDGNLSHLEAEDVATAAEWDGDTEAFMPALIKAGFMNKDRTLHDWEEHQGASFRKRLAEADKKRRQRDKRGTPRGQEGDRIGDTEGTEDDDQTRPEKTGQDLAKEEAPPVAREAQAVDNLGGGGADSTKNGNGKHPDLDDPVLWELWALPEWEKSAKADAALIAQIRAECPGVSLDAVFADYRLSAGDTKIGQPRRFMLGRAKTLAERAGPEAPPDLVRPEMVASLAAMVADGGRPEDLRPMCASEAEYAALLGHCGQTKKAVAQ